MDSDKLSLALREKGIDVRSRKVLVSRYDNSEQLADLMLPPNCGGWGRVHHFRRSAGENWPENPLPIDPAQHWLGSAECNEVQAQVFQNAICSWRCWYCFVDRSLVSANPKQSQFKSADELLDLYLSESRRPSIIDLSGGQPEMVPEWVLWFADALARRGLTTTTYLWSDDSLSNDFLWRYLTQGDIERLSSYGNYGRVGCFKGFDEASFSFNTSAKPELFDRQFEVMGRLVSAGFDVYGYTTLTSDTSVRLSARMASFVDRLQKRIHPLFPLRTVPLKIEVFTPSCGRMSRRYLSALEIQVEAVAAWTEELEKRFPSDIRRKRIHEHKLN